MRKDTTMALSTLEQNTVTKALTLAKQVIEQVKPVMDELDVIYNSASGAKTTITQAGLDAIPSFSGLTKQQLDDGLYALTATLKGDITTAYSQLAQLATRG